MSSESTFVVNVKTKVGTIVTVRGDTYEALQGNIVTAISGGIDKTIGALEEAILGDPAIAYAASTLGATIEHQKPNFAPVPPPQTPQPQASGAPAPVCTHGSMVIRTAKSGPRAGKDFWACTAPMNAPDKCKPVNIP